MARLENLDWIPETLDTTVTVRFHHDGNRVVEEPNWCRHLRDPQTAGAGDPAVPMSVHEAVDAAPPGGLDVTRRGTAGSVGGHTAPGRLPARLLHGLHGGGAQPLVPARHDLSASGR